MLGDVDAKVQGDVAKPGRIPVADPGTDRQNQQFKASVSFRQLSREKSKSVLVQGFFIVEARILRQRKAQLLTMVDLVIDVDQRGRDIGCKCPG